MRPAAHEGSRPSVSLAGEPHQRAMHDVFPSTKLISPFARFEPLCHVLRIAGVIRIDRDAVDTGSTDGSSLSS
jgi:hypothetical protein